MTGTAIPVAVPASRGHLLSDIGVMTKAQGAEPPPARICRCLSDPGPGVPRAPASSAAQVAAHRGRRRFPGGRPCTRRGGTGSGTGLPADPRVARANPHCRCSRQRIPLRRKAVPVAFGDCPRHHRGPLVRATVLWALTMPIRCAIYTRKSTDDGLEQEFNSLHAQREACEACIKSQRGMGWTALAVAYDDGGLSGGTLDRPALQQLLAGIQAHKVDTVVVYKVDRLTRSLAGFAKIVEVFDAHEVSFVSVTQQFNTTTSMGRLTLNMLLSFAQFEREVTGERIRDKIAASKRKGMWMGGPIPLGYDSRDKKLVVNGSEAGVVRKVFSLYLELGGADLLKQETDHLGLVTKRHEDGSGFRGGLAFSRGNLYQMLHNPIYAGEIAHKGKVYPGQHERIIAPGLWEAVQKRLNTNTRERQSPANITGTFILTGKLFDETGDRLSPASANRNGKRHRYYVSRRLLRTGDRSNGGWRLPARQLEQVVIDGVVALLNDPVRLSRELPSLSAGDTRRLLKGATGLASGTASEGHGQTGAMLPALLRRVTVSGGTIRIELSNRALLDGTTGSGMIDTIEPGELAAIEVPFQLRRRGVEIRLVLRAEGAETPDDKLAALVARSHRWLDQLTSGAIASIRGIAQAEGIDGGGVSRFLPLAFLAPGIVEALMNGSQGVELTAEKMRQILPIPCSWREQRHQLNL